LIFQKNFDFNDKSDGGRSAYWIDLEINEMKIRFTEIDGEGGRQSERERETERKRYRER
jgi:hypothetical protein